MSVSRPLWVTLLAASVSAFAQDNNAGNKPAPVLMDQPGDEQRLNREIWRAVRGTDYSEALAHIAGAQSAASTAASTVVLPTGWKLKPVGRQVNTGSLPFDAVRFRDSLVVINSGYSRGPQSLSVVPLTGGTEVRSIPLQNVFPGAAVSPDDSLYVSGGTSREVYRFDRQMRIISTWRLPGFVHGLAAYDAGHIIAAWSELPALEGLARPGHVVRIDTATGTVLRDTKVADQEPYSVHVAAGKVYATIPATNQVVVLDKDLNRLKTLDVGRTPQAACQDASSLFVVNSNSDDLSVIAMDSVIPAEKDTVVRRIAVPFLWQAWGAAPTSCAVDGNDLYVTLAHANAVAVLNKTTGMLRGYIPTGWYPTKVLSTGTSLSIISAKGIQPARPNPDGEYVLNLLKGTAAVLPKSEIAASLPGWTLQVASSAPSLALQGWASKDIKHIFYIVKENRTYDQVLGDLGKGNGDPFLTLFGRTVTPIQHYLAEEFVTLDNFYVDGEVSSTGHSYTASGYASPYLQLLTGLDYSGRLEGDPSFMPGTFSPEYLWDTMNAKGVNYRVYGEAIYLQSLFHIVNKHFGPQSELARKLKPLTRPGDTTRDAAAEMNKLFATRAREARTQSGMQALLSDARFGRSFSEIFSGDDTLYRAMRSNGNFFVELVSYLLRWQFDYALFDMGVSDLDRAGAWLNDFRWKDALGLVEQFHYIVLPNDHTAGNSPDRLTPTQYVAQNDAALDIVLRGLARSRVWSKSLVLVVEDDAQDGPDHVDATRTTAFAAGPWVKRRAVVSDRYDQISMVRTIGLLLGLNPISMNDALAAPMFGIFTLQPSPVYSPPPVSATLTAEDKQRYDALRRLLEQPVF